MITMFIEWNHFVDSSLTYTDINFKDYIIDNNLIDVTIKSLRKLDFVSGGKNKKGLQLIKEFEKYLLKDPDISLYVDAKNFNL